ncbi:MAG: protein kinase [Planctomycetota bacterium]
MRTNRFHPAIDSTVLTVAVIGSMGMVIWSFTIFVIPVVLVAALAIQRSLKVFAPVLFLAAVAIGIHLVFLSTHLVDWVHGSIGLVCLLVIGCLRWVKHLPRFPSTQPVPNLLVRNHGPSTTLPGGHVKFKDDVQDVQVVESDHRTITQLAPILDRLRIAGRFDAEQMELLRRELGAVLQPNSNEEILVVDVPIGTIIGRYKIVSELAKGGSGKVYDARPTDGGRNVALKLLLNAKATDRFRREMELVQHLAHPNVVTAYEVGTHRGMAYIAMERLGGPDLYLHVKRDGPMTWQQSLDVVLQAARGLEHAHSRKLIHRDVKPGNLVWDRDQVKVTDLGLAELTQPGALSDVINASEDSIAGTPDFMAPEQARGLANATEASDIYGLAATWYFLLTGKSRVKGTKIRDKLVCILAGNDFHDLCPTLLPQSIRSIWEKMIAYEVSDRYQSMSDVIFDLEEEKTESFCSNARDNVVVLVVEDDEDDLHLTLELMKRANSSVEVVTAKSLREGIQKANRHLEIDVVFLDLRLPDSQGVDTVKTFTNAIPALPVIVLTGQADRVLEAECREAGANEFLAKNDIDARIMERLIFVTFSLFDQRPP